MLRTASSLPPEGLLTLGSDPARFQTEPPACYRASWQLPGPDSHRQATTSLRTARSTMAYVTVSPPALLGARKIRASDPFRETTPPSELTAGRRVDSLVAVVRSRRVRADRSAFRTEIYR